MCIPVCIYYQSIYIKGRGTGFVYTSLYLYTTGRGNMICVYVCVSKIKVYNMYTIDGRIGFVYTFNCDVLGLLELVLS